MLLAVSSLLGCGGGTLAPADASADLAVDTRFDATDGGAKDATTADGPGDTGLPDVKLDYDGGLLLPYRVLSADYSRALDLMVIVGTDDALHLVDPHTLSDTPISLSGGVYVSVSPDGLRAAVAQQAQLQVTYLDLAARSLLGTYQLGQNPPGYLLFAGSDHVYVMPTSPLPGDGLIDVALTTSQASGVKLPGSFIPGSVSRDGGIMFLVDSTCATLWRFFMTDDGGIAQEQQSFDQPCCAAWITPDNADVYLGCGQVLGAGSLQQTTSLSAAAIVTAVDFYSMDKTVAVLAAPDGGGGLATQLQTYDIQSLGLLRTQALPPIEIDGSPAPSFGRYVFHDTAGTKTFAIIAAPKSAAHAPDQLTFAIVPF